MILVEKMGDIGKITLNRPEKGNALNSEMLRRLYDALKELEDAKVIIIGGAGKNFCSGHDLNEFLDDPLSIKRHLELCWAVMHKIRGTRQVVIAEVKGYAMAGGCQLVAVCDLAVASENARFGLPGIRFGLFCFAPTVFVSRCVSVKRVFELAFTGDEIDARTALDWGLVNRVVPDESLEEETLKLAERIARHDMEAIGEGKRFFYAQMNMNEFDALSFGVNTIALHSTRVRDRIEEFLKKRAKKDREE